MASFTAVNGFIDNGVGGDESQTVTPNLSDLIVLVLASSGSTTDPAPHDNNSDGLGGVGTWYKAASHVKHTSADKITCWIRNGLIGSASSTVFTGGLPASGGSAIYVLQIAGMSRVGAAAVRTIGGVPQSGGEDNTTSPPTPALPAAALATNLLITGEIDDSNLGPALGPTGFTVRVRDGQSAPNLGIGVATINSGKTLTSYAWGSSSASIADFIVELDASAPVAGQAPNNFTVSVIRLS